MSKMTEQRFKRIDTLRHQRDELLAACEAAIAYDSAIHACANDPNKMASYCSAQGDTLDALYDAWITKSLNAIAKVKREA